MASLPVFRRMERARESVTFLLNDVWLIAVIYFGSASSRILWIKFRFSRVKICLVVGYGPNEGNGEEKEMFWNVLDRIVDREDRVTAFIATFSKS